MKLPFRRRGNRPRGQALVEFALILPIAVLILMGIIQFGFLFAGQIAQTNAVREATRYGSTSPVSDSGTATTNGTNICKYLRDSAMAQLPGYDKNRVVYGGATYVTYQSYKDPNNATYSVRLTVHVAYKHPLLVPIISNLIDALDGSTDQAFRLTATEKMRVENPVLQTDPALNTTVNCVVSP